MSELGITVYSVLLVWMRAVNDWFWSVLSGGGHGLYTLVLSHWKTWLVVLVAAGLIADWLVWMVRWRPLRLIFGKRVRASEQEDEAQDWDMDEQPYYGPDDDDDVGYSAMDKADWTDNTLRTLSEIDPDWAENLTLDAPEVLEENPPEPPRRRVDDPWAETPDEYDDYAFNTEAEAENYAEKPAFQPQPADEAEPQWQQPSPALYDADGMDEAMEGGTRVFGRASAPVKRHAPLEPAETFSAAQPEEPAAWANAPAQEDASAQEAAPAWESAADASYAAPPTRRRRRSIREATEEELNAAGYRGEAPTRRRAVREALSAPRNIICHFEREVFAHRLAQRLGSCLGGYHDAADLAAVQRKRVGKNALGCSVQPADRLGGQVRAREFILHAPPQHNKI